MSEHRIPLALLVDFDADGSAEVGIVALLGRKDTELKAARDGDTLVVDIGPAMEEAMQREIEEFPGKAKVFYGPKGP